MEIKPDCLPCVLSQAIKASKIATGDVNIQQLILDETINLIEKYKAYKNPADMGRDMHLIVKKHSKLFDPYIKIKQDNITEALEVYGYLKSFLLQKQNDIVWALKIAATGNYLDSTIYSNLDVKTCIEQELHRDFSICDVEIFSDKLSQAKKILFIGDNAGETVFDRILIESIKDKDITYAVRHEPIINDITMEEAYLTGIDACAKIITTGCNAPGVLFNECSEEFLETYLEADIVLSKGQGNYESLSEDSRDIFFLLKAKCPVIAKAFGKDLNDYIFKYKSKV